MRDRSRTSRIWAWAIGALALAGPAAAQVQSGNVYGEVADQSGQPLPGVALTLSGAGAPSVQVSDAQGQFRFVGVYPGTYRLEGSLDGFSPIVYETVTVNLNRNTTLSLTMNQAVAETITITAESPLLDARKITTGATIDKTELEKIPTARDPWVILQTTPGIMMDRVNVGGNESGQQAVYVSAGDDGTNTSWAIDGVEITDLGAIGSSSSYYDFDAFEEMQVTTGGSDASVRVGGAGMNLVTKRGTNEWRGSGRYLVSDDSWQSDFELDKSDLGKAGPWNDFNAQPSFKQGNRIVKVEDYGAELGGPILKDKLWVWGSYGKNDINLLTIDDYADNTLLETWNAKVNWQIAQNNAATVFFSNNDKTKVGRNASPTRPPETTWNQSGLASDPNVFGFFSERPTVAKIEDTHIFGSTFFLTASYAESDGGFQLIPQGGISEDQKNTSFDDAFVAHNTYILYQSARPQDQYKADGSYFFSTGSLNHELKFGANYRKATVDSYSRWPGFGIDFNFYKSYGYSYNVVQVSRASNIRYQAEYTNGYVQDTLTSGRLTANVGVRYDHQKGTDLPHSIAAVKGFEDLLPASSYQGGLTNVTWKDFSPRLGLTWALGEERTTLIRASYARFAEQLNGAFASWNDPGYPGAYVYMYYDDRNGDGSAQRDEIVPGILWTNESYNPFNPSQELVSDRVDPNLDAQIVDEVVIGIEHALAPEFVVGLTATLRNESKFFEADALVFDGDAFSAENINQLGRVHRRDDYVPVELSGTLPNGQTYTTYGYVLRDGVTTRGGTYLNNSDRERNFVGLALTFNKRLSNQWMMRGNVTWNDWTWDIPDHEREDLTQDDGGGNKDGDRYINCVGTGSGAKGNVCISGSWAYSLNGMYQVAPDKAWGFNVAASLNGHEGYAMPYWRRFNNGNLSNNCTGGKCTTVVDPVDDIKGQDVHTVDLRLEKELKFDRVGVTLGVDCFNVLNANTVLQRNLRLNQSKADHATEVLSPRIFRVGARVSFN